MQQWVCLCTTLDASHGEGCIQVCSGQRGVQFNQRGPLIPEALALLSVDVGLQKHPPAVGMLAGTPEHLKL